MTVTHKRNFSRSLAALAAVAALPAFAQLGASVETNAIYQTEVIENDAWTRAIVTEVLGPDAAPELKDRMGVRVVVYHPDSKTWLISPLSFPTNQPSEGEGQVNMVLPEVWNGTKIHVWAYGQELQNLNASEYNVLALGAASSDLSKADGNSLFSKTTYLGQGTIG